MIETYGEGEPLYLCGDHATAIGLPHDNCVAGVRLIEGRSANGDNQLKDDQRARNAQSAVATELSSIPPKGVLATKGIRREKVPSHRRRTPDLTFGNSAKALVDEAIWNIPTGDCNLYRAALLQGKSTAEAAHSAGGQVEIIHRKISEYALKIEAVLSTSKATIDAREVIEKPFEHALLEIINQVSLSEAEKDRATEYLGAFQEQINRGLDREITPIRAHRIAQAIGDRANWGIGESVSNDLRPALREVYCSVRNAVRVAAPEVNDLEERLANLCAAKSDLEIVASAKVSPSKVPT